MAKTTNGNCTNCGRKGVLSVLHGGKVCNTCRYLLAAANNNVPALAGAVRTVGKVEEMIKALIPDGGRLAVQVTATLLQEISGIVGYDGEEPAELVEAVRRRVLACASCEAEDVLREIREIVGYVPEQGDSRLAEVVRQQLAGQSVLDCTACTNLKGDMLMACDLDLDLGTAQDWDYVVAAAIQTIGQLTNRRDDLLTLLTYERANNAGLRKEIMGQRTAAEFERIRADLIRAEQDRDEWEQRAVQAESNVETLEAELRNWENSPIPCTDNTLLDIALRALRGEGPDADQLAMLLDAARRAA